MRQTGSLLFLIVLLTFTATCVSTSGENAQAVEEVFLPDGDGVRVDEWVRNLEVPWSLVFLPDGRALVSERPGRIRLIKNGVLHKEPYARLDVNHAGEGGLMGLAVHPDFPKQPYIYAMHTYKKNGSVFNRVVRLRDGKDRGTFDKIIIDNIPGARNHNGGRIGFGPDRLLYITTGETFEADLSQDRASLGGKILRVTPEGQIPPDNPFGDSPVYAYGLRNPQGMAWHPRTGSLFVSDHGPSGERLRFGNDEVNVIVKGGNYGWPRVIGTGRQKEYIDPIVLWEKATPPAGITFYNGDLLKKFKGDLFVATLKSRTLIRIVLDKDAEKIVRMERWFATDGNSGKYGRLRDVVVGPDGALYFLSSNRDGRGDPLPGDDKIYRIVPDDATRP
jgi:glucose/arabinose dehydrogenase